MDKFSQSFIKPSSDVQPVSTFRANAAGFVQQVRDTKRPLVLTQYGRSAAVLLDVEEYEAMLEELASLKQGSETVPGDPPATRSETIQRSSTSKLRDWLTS